MRTIASIATSSDGFIDDASPQRLVLSDEADWAEVYVLRKSCDAILVGAQTIRNDNPSLKFAQTKVIVSGSGNIPTRARVFDDEGKVIIFTTNRHCADALRQRAEVVVLAEIGAKTICKELEKRDVERLLVEGGARTMEMFFAEDCIDEFREAIAPVYVKEGIKKPIFNFQFSIFNSTRKVGQMVVNEYIIHPDFDLVFLERAITLSRLTPPSKGAYSVGCVVVTTNGDIFTGYTHQTDPHNHAEEEAIEAALREGADLRGATAYCSMEPCSTRKSKPTNCSQLLIKYGFSRVVYAASEPDCFVMCEGADNLRKAGISVRRIKELECQVLDINRHILK